MDVFANKTEKLKQLVLNFERGDLLLIWESMPITGIFVQGDGHPSKRNVVVKMRIIKSGTYKKTTMWNNPVRFQFCYCP